MTNKLDEIKELQRKIREAKSSLKEEDFKEILFTQCKKYRLVTLHPQQEDDNMMIVLEFYNSKTKKWEDWDNCEDYDEFEETVDKHFPGTSRHHDLEDSTNIDGPVLTVLLEYLEDLKVDNKK